MTQCWAFDSKFYPNSILSCYNKNKFQSNRTQHSWNSHHLFACLDFVGKGKTTGSSCHRFPFCNIVLQRKRSLSGADWFIGIFYAPLNHHRYDGDEKSWRNNFLLIVYRKFRSFPKWTSFNFVRFWRLFFLMIVDWWMINCAWSQMWELLNIANMSPAPHHPRTPLWWW